MSTSEVAGALLGMVANALRVAMVTGLPVVRGDPIPDNHVAVFRECEAPQGRILLVSLLRFCVLLLFTVEEPMLGGEGLAWKLGGPLSPGLCVSAHNICSLVESTTERTGWDGLLWRSWYQF